jgi:hypothetical protein
MRVDWDALSGTIRYMGMMQFQSGEDYVPGVVSRSGISLVTKPYVIRKNDQS